MFFYEITTVTLPKLEFILARIHLAVNGVVKLTNSNPSHSCSELVDVLNIIVPGLKFCLSLFSVLTEYVLRGSTSPKFSSNTLTKRLKVSDETFSSFSIGSRVGSNLLSSYRLVVDPF